MSTHVQSQTKLIPPLKLMGRLLCHLGVTHLLYQTQEALEPMAARLFEELSLNNIIHCPVPWESSSTVFARQAMHTSTVHPPAVVTIMGNIKIRAHSEGNGNPKALRVR